LSRANIRQASVLYNRIGRAFHWLPKLMTLNDLEWRSGFILPYFT